MSITRALFDRAIDGIRIPPSAHALLHTLWRAADWISGKILWSMSWGRLEARARLPESTVEWGMRWLRRAGLVVVVERDNTGTYLELDLPDHLRQRIGLPTHLEEELLHARAEDAEELAWDEQPAARGVLGGLVDVSKGIVRTATNGLVSLADLLSMGPPEAPREPVAKPSSRYIGRPNFDPAPLSESDGCNMRRKDLPPLPTLELRPPPEVYADPAEHPDARHVGALYESRDEAEEARRAKLGPPSYDGIGDKSPHRALWIAYRLAYLDQVGREPVMRSAEHKGIQILLRRFGLDAAMRLVGEVDWVDGYIGLWDLCWALRWGDARVTGDGQVVAT